MRYYTLAFMNLFLGAFQWLYWYEYQDLKFWMFSASFNLLLAAVYLLLANLVLISDRNRHLDAVDKFSNILTQYLAGKIPASELMLTTTGLAWNISHDKKFERVADNLQGLYIYNLEMMR